VYKLTQPYVTREDRFKVGKLLNGVIVFSINLIDGKLYDHRENTYPSLRTSLEIRTPDPCSTSLRKEVSEL
jgi:hypothetical protein